MKHDQNKLDQLCTDNGRHADDVAAEHIVAFSIDDAETVAKQYAEHVVASKQVHNTLLNGINVKNGEAILSLEGGACALLANAFAGQFKDSGATNYLVLDVHHDDTGPMTITMQRRDGSTPAEKLKRMAARVAELEGALQESHTELSISKRFADALTKKCMTAMGVAGPSIVDRVMADRLKDRRSIKPHPLLQEQGS